MIKYKDVAEFLADLPTEKRAQVEMLRGIIMKTEPNLVENLKWNAPNYALQGEDRITFNVMNKQGLVKVILHMGATKVEDKKAAPVMSDTGGLVEWNSNIRGTITFGSMDDVLKSEAVLPGILQKWLALS
ncbi:hypothetical protein BH09PAT3_BH09PAT3_3330 [soil metagenome]